MKNRPYYFIEDISASLNQGSGLKYIFSDLVLVCLVNILRSFNIPVCHHLEPLLLWYIMYFVSWTTAFQIQISFGAMASS